MANVVYRGEFMKVVKRTSKIYEVWEYVSIWKRYVLDRTFDNFQVAYYYAIYMNKTHLETKNCFKWNNDIKKRRKNHYFNRRED